MMLKSHAVVLAIRLYASPGGRAFVVGGFQTAAPLPPLKIVAFLALSSPRIAMTTKESPTVYEYVQLS